MGQFEFEPISFGIGAAGGVLTTLAVQRVNRFIRERNEGRERAVVRTFASRTADEGYLASLVERARETHLLGSKIRLEEVLVEPRFIPPPELIEIRDEDVPIENVFETVPRIHDYPHLHAPYNIKTLSIADLGRGHRRIIMVGLPGSGRTTALLTIALWSSGFMEFPPKRDAIIQEIEDNLDPKKDVPVEEQVLRIRRRVALAKMTEEKRKMRGDNDEDSRPVDPTESSEEVLIEAPVIFREIAPIYVHLADIILTSREYGNEIDPTEPLIRAMQHNTGYLSSRRLVNKTYKLLENGSAIIMVDGFDDILADNRPQALRWMNSLMDLYPKNFFIFAMPPQGYGVLMENGAVPVFLRPWHKQDMSDSIDKIEQGWDHISKKPIEFPTADFETPGDWVQTIKPGGERLLAFDHVLRTYSILTSHETEETTYTDRIHNYLLGLYPKAEEILPELKRMATVQLDQGFITLRNLVDYAVAREKLGEDPQLTRTITSDLQAVQLPVDEEDIEEQEIDEENLTEEEKEQRNLEKEVSGEQSKLLERLVKSGVLLAFRGGRYQFRHKLLASYLAAIDLADVSEEIVYRKYIKPDWEYAMNYLVSMRDVDFLVAEQLDNPLDVRMENVLKLANWLRYASSDVPWRNNLLRYLGNLFATPNQFSIIRERVAAALVSSRDDGAKVVFRKGLQTKVTEIRRLACYALGAMKDEKAADALQQVILQDPDVENKMAAQMALIAIGTEEALFAAVDLMDVAPQEEVRRAVTENLAADATLGYPTIRDMLLSDSIAMRRAALYGAARVNTEWSWILMDRIFQNDTESFVRLASEVTLLDKFNSSFYMLQPYPEVEEVPWLINWSLLMQENGLMTYDTEASEALEMAFEQAENPGIRWLMTGTIGQLGQYHMIDKVYQALQDEQELIRDQAYRALAEFQEKLGKPIAIPVS